MEITLYIQLFNRLVFLNILRLLNDHDNEINLKQDYMSIQ